MIVRFIGMGVGFLSMYLAYEWYGWELCVILFLSIFGENLNKSKF